MNRQGPWPQDRRGKCAMPVSNQRTQHSWMWAKASMCQTHTTGTLDGIIPICPLPQNWKAPQVAQMVNNLPAMRETWVWFLGQEDPLEKEMAIHSSTLAWKIPWTKELDRLQSMGSQRVGHDWATSLHFAGIEVWKFTSKNKLILWLLLLHWV